MNVLVLEFITSVGGVQTVYKNMLPYLAKDNKIFFLDPYQNEFNKQLQGIENVKVLEIPIKSKSALWWDDSFIKKISILLKYGYIYMIYIFVLSKLIKEKKIKLIYVSGKKEIIIAYILFKILGVKYLYHAHGFNSHKDISFLFRLCINNAEKIIAVSNCVKDVLIQAEVKKENIKVIYNGLNIMTDRSYNMELSINNEISSLPFKIIIVGTIQPKKGIHTLIRAVNILLKQGLNVSLDIVGDITINRNQKYKDELFALSDEVDKKKFSFLGFQNNVHEYITNANLLVLPSTEESFGMTLIEAMYLSKPVIGTNIGGIPEVISDGVNGFLFEPNNEVDLSKKISLLYKDKDLCSKMGANGFERVNNLFTCDKQAHEIIKVIDDIANKGITK